MKTTEEITQGLVENGKVTIKGFGTFKVSTRKARTGRNPKTGEAIKIAESKTVRFKPSKELKGKL